MKLIDFEIEHLNLCFLLTFFNSKFRGELPNPFFWEYLNLILQGNVLHLEIENSSLLRFPNSKYPLLIKTT